jgi:hypothetical protein
MTSRHAEAMDADAFWRQFVVAFYFETPGDELVGTLVKYRAEGPRDEAVPCFRVQRPDGRVVEVTAHQERLKVELVKAAPAIGDRVKIVYTGEAAKAAPGMNKAKLFTVEVRRQGSQPPGRPGSEASGEVGPENGPGAGSKGT